jgi:hypothetical protein
MPNTNAPNQDVPKMAVATAFPEQIRDAFPLGVADRFIMGILAIRHLSMMRLVTSSQMAHHEGLDQRIRQFNIGAGVIGEIFDINPFLAGEAEQLLAIVGAADAVLIDHDLSSPS